MIDKKDFKWAECPACGQRYCYLPAFEPKTCGKRECVESDKGQAAIYAGKATGFEIGCQCDKINTTEVQNA